MKSGMFQQLDSEVLIKTFTVNSLSTRNACITEISVMVQDQLVTARGTSRRNPEDKHVPAYGQLLAYSRAFQSLAAKLERRGEGLLLHLEHIAVQRPAQLKKAAEWRAANPGKINTKKSKKKASKKSPVSEVTLVPSKAAGKIEKPAKAVLKKSAKAAKKKSSK